MAASFSNSAVSNDVVRRSQLVLLDVNLPQLGGIFEGAILLVDRPPPRDAQCTRNMSTAERAFVRVLGHVQPLAAVLFRTADIYQGELRLQMLEHPVAECTEASVVAFGRLVLAGLIFGNFARKRPLLVDPLSPATIDDFGTLCPKSCNTQKA